MPDILADPTKFRMTTSVDDVDEILYEVKDGVAHITLNNPDKLNACTFEMYDALVDGVKRAEGDDDVKVIALKGAGDNFTVGQELSQVYKVYENFDGDDAGKRRASERARIIYDYNWHEHYRQLYYSLKPIITQIHGWAIGAGVFLNYCADISIAAESAKLSHREERLVFAGGVMPELAIHELGRRKARELMLTGETISGKEAERIGLVNKVVPDDELENEVERYCEAIKLLPKDGIVMGKMTTNIAMESLGMGQAWLNAAVGHALGTNIRFDEDEYNFIGTRGKEDTRKAIENLHNRFDELGFN